MEDETSRRRPQRRDYVGQRRHTPVHTVTDLRPQAAAEQPPAPARRRRFVPKKRSGKKKILLPLIVLLVLAGAGVFWYLGVRNPGPLPKNVQKSIGFVLYYPSTLPSGYLLQKDSAKVDVGVLFYSLGNSKDKVIISEQAAPANPPDFKQLESFNTSFKDVSTDAGQAILGTNPQNKAYVGIISTNTTLVSLTASSKDVPRDIMAKLIQNMSSVGQ